MTRESVQVARTEEVMIGHDDTRARVGEVVEAKTSAPELDGQGGGYNVAWRLASMIDRIASVSARQVDAVLARLEEIEIFKSTDANSSLRRGKNPILRPQDLDQAPIGIATLPDNQDLEISKNDLTRSVEEERKDEEDASDHPERLESTISRARTHQLTKNRSSNTSVLQEDVRRLLREGASIGALTREIREALTGAKPESP
eukprot:CAMPEP_0171499058 /NCGR_PEP_ID=MMETSP0958-20121227/8222_1 /TAXON_ID=87120 /ORGANISM="Aurantiochytrium limacinum, Strain ATCCMYA-1381" /LENGTH=201 /DNA_ID=CAMNT_0012033581 /DNA_START=23 /DNA_END=628 /DNA_ORIENTATION=+